VDSTRPGALGIGQRVDLSAIAALTDGFSGAELEFLVNEAAIRAVRRISDSLRDGSSHGDITPHVRASDFEESLANFFATRRQRSGPSLFKNVWKQ
jgi:SpoVK/Ycf46/Vps4 family AAA+-type ATPase